MTQDLTGTRVQIKTDAGDMTVEFLHDKAPGHVANFVKNDSNYFFTGKRYSRMTQ